MPRGSNLAILWFLTCSFDIWHFVLYHNRFFMIDKVTWNCHTKGLRYSIIQNSEWRETMWKCQCKIHLRFLTTLTLTFCLLALQMRFKQHDFSFGGEKSGSSCTFSWASELYNTSSCIFTANIYKPHIMTSSFFSVVIMPSGWTMNSAEDAVEQVRHSAMNSLPSLQISSAPKLKC